MSDKSIPERVAVVETALQIHVMDCKRKAIWNFRILLLILGAVITQVGALLLAIYIRGI